MALPTFVEYDTEDEYRRHFEEVYCREKIAAFDGIKVKFRKSKFEHCFFESSNKNQEKDTFSIERAKRIDWIKTALETPHGELRVGWSKKYKCYDRKRRVTIIMGNYVVVIELLKKNGKKADFITAYVADNSTLEKIRKGPEW
jgi:hypothetical protein